MAKLIQGSSNGKRISWEERVGASREMFARNSRRRSTFNTLKSSDAVLAQDEKMGVMPPSA